MKHEKKRRPWRRYSLRGLFLVTTVLCVWLAILFNQARRQRNAVRAITSAGGVVAFDYHFRKNSKDAQPPGPAWLRRLIGDELFRTPQHVELRGDKITDEFLAEHLTGLRGVEFLSIDSNRVTDAGLSKVAQLHSIDILSLECPVVTDAGLAKVARMRRLHTLGLKCPRVTDAGMQHLARLDHLKALNLTCPQITSEGVKLLSPLKNLEFVACLREPGNEELSVRRHSRRDVELIDVPRLDALEIVAETYYVHIDIAGVPAEQRVNAVRAVGRNQTLDATLDAILGSKLDYYLEKGTIKVAPRQVAEANRAGERAFRETLLNLERLAIDW